MRDCSVLEYLQICRDTSSVLDTHTGRLTMAITLDLRSLIAFSGYLGVLCTHMYRYTHVYNLKGKINLKNNVFQILDYF